MTPTEAIAAALIAAACNRIPALKTAFDQLTPAEKQLSMIIMRALVVIATTIATCATSPVCTRATWQDSALDTLAYAILAFLQAIAINQGVHKLTK